MHHTKGETTVQPPITIPTYFLFIYSEETKISSQSQPIFD
nr:MAG TPA: hypothetical protein [Caudoviricetes sp.]